MELSTVDTTVVFIHPQVDVLSPDGKNWVFKGPFAVANLHAEFDSAWNHVVQHERCAPRGLVSKRPHGRRKEQDGNVQDRLLHR
jgi:hypothetical protein